MDNGSGLATRLMEENLATGSPLAYTEIPIRKEATNKNACLMFFLNCAIIMYVLTGKTIESSGTDILKREANNRPLHSSYLTIANIHIYLKDMPVRRENK